MPPFITIQKTLEDTLRDAILRRNLKGLKIILNKIQKEELHNFKNYKHFEHYLRRLMLKTGLDPEDTFDSQRSLFHESVQRMRDEEFEELRMILTYIKHPNAPMDNNSTPLYHFIKTGSSALANELLKHPNLDFKVQPLLEIVLSKILHYKNCFSNTSVTPHSSRKYSSFTKKYFNCIKVLLLNNADEVFDYQKLKELDMSFYRKIDNFVKHINQGIAQKRHRLLRGYEISLPSDIATKRLLRWEWEQEKSTCDSFTNTKKAFSEILAAILEPTAGLKSEKKLGKIQTLPSELRQMIVEAILKKCVTIELAQPSQEQTNSFVYSKTFSI